MSNKIKYTITLELEVEHKYMNEEDKEDLLQALLSLDLGPDLEGVYWEHLTRDPHHNSSYEINIKSAVVKEDK